MPPPAPSRSIPELLAEMESDDTQTRAAAAFELAGAGEVGVHVVRALLLALDDPDEEVRENACWALLHVRNPALDYPALYDSTVSAVGPSCRRPVGGDQRPGPSLLRLGFESSEAAEHRHEPGEGRAPRECRGLADHAERSTPRNG